MKYYVLGKSNNIKATRDNDSASLQEYWEMGYEISASRILLLRKLYHKEINQSDVTIVTLFDRMYMYESLFENVIPYEEFKKMDHRGLDICWDFSDHGFVNSPTYHQGVCIGSVALDYDIRNFEKGFLDMITDTKRQPIQVDKPFYLIHYRERSRCPERNLSVDEYERIFRCIEELGYDFYVYGQNSDSIVSKYKKEGLTLREANSYMDHKDCLGVVGPLSGGTMIALLTHKFKHHVIDINRQNVPSPIKFEGNDTNPVLHGPASNFIGAEIINHFTVNDFIDYITNKNI